MQILAVDDEPGVRALLDGALTRAGHRVITAACGREALATFASVRPDLVILDVGLPDLDGFEVCRRIKLEAEAPVILLTARGAEEDVLRGFGVGADDYLTKPFSVPVLVARVAAIFARTVEARRQEGHRLLLAGPIALDLESGGVWRDGESVRLARLQFRLLHILVANLGRVVPYSRLIEFTWGHEGGNRAALRVQIAGLRKKLGLPPDGEGSITSVSDTGYTLRGA